MVSSKTIRLSSSLIGDTLNERRSCRHFLSSVLFHIRKVGLFVAGAVCVWRANASKCSINAVTKIASAEGRNTTPTPVRPDLS